MKLKKIAAFMLAAMLLLTSVLPVYASEGDTEGERFNIVIVTDNSGSLVNGNRSDPDGYRHDAISMFLDLLTESGNNVAAVVFSGNSSLTDNSPEAMLSGLKLNTDLLPMESQADKDALVKKIKAIPATGYTDIGTALLAAAQKLDGMTAKNGLRSIIVLFSDGITETYDKNTNDKLPADQQKPDTELPVYSQSLANKEQAKQIIRDNGITLCGVYLSGKYGDAENSEVLNLVLEGNNCDESLTMDDIEDLYISVDNAKDLANAYERFFTLITGTGATEFKKELEFEVPGMGVADINISLLAQGDTLQESQAIMDATSLTIIRPDQTQVTGRELAQMMSQGSSYAVYKLQGLEAGVWKVSVNTPDLEKLRSSLLLSTNVTAVLSVDMDTDEFIINRPISVSAQLLRGGKALPDQEAYQQYACFLEIMNADNPKAEWTRIPMEYQTNSNSFGCRISMDNFGKYHARVVFSCGDAIRITTGTEPWPVRNQNPQAPETETVPLVLSLSSPGAVEVNLRDLVTDREDPVEKIAITVNGANYNPDAYSVDGDILHIDGVIGGSGVMYVSFADTHGGVTTTELQIEFTDIASEQIMKITVGVIVLLVALVALIVIKRIINNLKANLEGTVKMSVAMGEKVISLKFNARACLNKTLWKILNEDRVQLATEAKWRGVQEATLEAFLKKNKKKLSSIRILSVQDKHSKTNICRVVGATGGKSVNDLNDMDSIDVALRTNGGCINLQYCQYL